MMEEQNELSPAVAALVEAIGKASKQEHQQCLEGAKELGASLLVNSGERLTWQNMEKLLRAERRRFSR